jgi:outer membrane protein TolC
MENMNFFKHKNNASIFLKIKEAVLFLPVILLFNIPLYAQDTTHVSLQKAIQMGLDSSKQLHLSQAKIQETITRLEQVKDKKLPDIKASLMGSEAFIPTRTLQIEGLMKKPLHLPATSTLYLGTLSIEEAIFAGNKLRYAEQSASLMKKIARLNAAHDTTGVVFNIIQSYINLYKIDENLKILERNIKDIQGRLNETIQFKNQGLATENDVLRFQLQKAQAKLSQIELKNNREVANYAMNILLGLPETTTIVVDSIGRANGNIPPLQHFIQQALQSRKDLAVYNYRNKLSHINIKNIKADKLPVLGAGVTTYYLNPNTSPFPPAHSFLMPITLGLNLSWNISSLYTTKNKVSEAKVKQQEVKIAKNSATDRVRIEVKKNYQDYLQTLQRIKVLKTAVAQAKENDRIMELKYRNQLATTTDRIDAQTMLYQSLINLELAKADAAVSWYQLLSSTGDLNLPY